MIRDRGQNEESGDAGSCEPFGLPQGRKAEAF